MNSFSDTSPRSRSISLPQTLPTTSAPSLSSPVAILAVGSPTPRSRRDRLKRWSASALIAVIAGFCASRSIHPFLAPTDRVAKDVLVIEGWVPDYALEAGVAEFRAGGYRILFTTGGPVPSGSHLAEYDSYAEVAAAELRGLGLATNEVTAVPTAERYRNRTFASAVALREYCEVHKVEIRSINVVTVGSHARRSRLCFRRALGDQIPIGVIAVEDRDYDPRHWWRYSEGVKTIIEECVALPYAWLSLDYGP